MALINATPDFYSLAGYVDVSPGTRMPYAHDVYPPFDSLTKVQNGWIVTYRWRYGRVSIQGQESQTLRLQAVARVNLLKSGKRGNRIISLTGRDPYEQIPRIVFEEGQQFAEGDILVEGWLLGFWKLDEETRAKVWLPEEGGNGQD